MTAQTLIYPAVMVTGHRRYANPDWVASELARLAVKLRTSHGAEWAISGMALGADQAWAEAALASSLQLWAHVPFPQQSRRWTIAQHARWCTLLSRAAREECDGDVDIADPKAVYARLHARNRGMLAAADLCIAVWDGRREGGTWSAVRTAVHAGKPIIHVDPVRQQTTFPEAAGWKQRTRQGSSSQ